MKPKRFPAVNPSLCVKCRKCIDICPAQAISAVIDPANYYVCAKCIKYCLSMDVPCRPETMVFSYDLCNSCGECVPACAFGALHWISANKVQDKNSIQKNIIQQI